MKARTNPHCACFQAVPHWGVPGGASAPADRATVRYARVDVGPAEEGQRGMIEIIIVERVDRRVGAARGQKRIDPTIFKKDRHGRGGLIAKILSHDPAVRRRIVGRTDAAQAGEAVCSSS